MDGVIQIAVYHGHISKCAIRKRQLIHRIEHRFIIELIINKALIIHTEHDVNNRVGIVLLHALGIRLISHQRRLRSKDTHIINDEVISVKVRRQVIDSYTEMGVFLGELDGEEDLIPVIGRLNRSRHIGRNILPYFSVLRALYGDCKVRISLAGLVAGIAHIAGEVQFLTLAQFGLQRERCHLTGSRHTVAVKHIAVFRTSVLLYRTPPVGIIDFVDQRILTRSREVFLCVVTVLPR